MSHEPRKARHVPVVFGDVALLLYPNGDRVLGGQAFGMAWHLRGLGTPALLVTRVGGDAASAEAVAAMQQWDLDILGVQRADDQSLGTLEVRIGDEPPWVTAPGCQPWDSIDVARAVRAVRERGCALLAHGGRCLRGASNRRALERLIDETGAPIYFDATDAVSLNDAGILEGCLARSTWVTVRESVLPTIAATLGSAACAPQPLAECLRERYDLAALFVVADVRGAYAITESDEPVCVAPDGELDVIDRVGVEEAFSAVAVYGLLAGWSIGAILRHAQGFAELIAALPVPEIPTGAFYEDVRGQWEAEGAPDAVDRADSVPVRASIPITRHARLPAELEEAAGTLDDLRERRKSARMRASVASRLAENGDEESHTALRRAERSVERISERIDETRQRIRSLRRAGKAMQTERDDDAGTS